MAVTKLAASHRHIHKHAFGVPARWSDNCASVTAGLAKSPASGQLSTTLAI